MNDSVRFHRLVPDDLADAIRWYDAISPQLANRFREAVNDMLDRIAQSPLMYAEDRDGLRYASIKNFPYLIQYSTQGPVPLIVGVYHSSSNPDSWRQRVQNIR